MNNGRVVPCVVVFGILAWISHGATVSEVRESLRNHGIPFDSDKIMEGALRGALTALDSGARIVATEDVDKLHAGDVIVLSEKWAEDICYVKLGGMFPGGGPAFLERVRELAPFCGTGMILDMRGSGGDDLGCMDEIAGILLRGSNTQYRVRHGTNTVMRSVLTIPEAERVEPFRENVPLTLLIDSTTVGASEVLAAILKGHGRTVLLGVPTSGGLSLRGVVPLSAKEVLYLVTHQIVSIGESRVPDGGVEPDILVSPGSGSSVAGMPSGRDARGRELSDRASRDRDLMIRVSGDPALARAADILLGLRALSGIGQTSAVLSDSDRGNGKE